jgi:hypothetical protein
MLKETIGYVSSVTQIPLEMNFIKFYNVDTLSTTVLNVLKFKNMTITKKSDLLKLCKIIKVINEGVCAPG